MYMYMYERLFCCAWQSNASPISTSFILLFQAKIRGLMWRNKIQEKKRVTQLSFNVPLHQDSVSKAKVIIDGVTVSSLSLSVSLSLSLSVLLKHSHITYNLMYMYMYMHINCSLGHSYTHTYKLYTVHTYIVIWH